MQRAKNKFIEFKNVEMLKLEKDKDIWRENLKIVDSLLCKETDILDLDIGGTHKLTTTRSTLTKVNTLFFTSMIVSQFCIDCNVLGPSRNSKTQQ